MARAEGSRAHGAHRAAGQQGARGAQGCRARRAHRAAGQQGAQGSRAAGRTGLQGSRARGVRRAAVLGFPSICLPPPFLCPPPDLSQPPLQPASPLPAPSPYTEQSGALTERREPASRPVSPVRPAHRVPRSRLRPVPGTHAMALRPSSIPLRVPQPAPPESSHPESSAASALVAELLEFAAACRLKYATALLAESVSASPSSVGGECALGTDVLEDRQEDFECLAAAVPRFASMLLAPEGDPDAPDIPTPRSYAEAITSTYVEEVPPPGANIVDGMWIFMVKRPPGSPPAFKARYVAQGFSQRQGVDYFQAFSPTSKMTTLWVLLHIAAQCDYELHSMDFSTAFLQGSLHEEIWLRHPPCFTGTFPAGTQWSLRRPVYGLRLAPHEWHNTLRTTLAALGFAPSTADPSLFLRTDTSLPPFYVLVYVDDLVFATADTEALTLVNSSCEAEIYAGAMAAQELYWLTYLLTELGEQPRSPPVLYVDSKAMIGLYQEHRLEHRTKHIALRYFLARELQQCGQLCLAYVATRANTADVFTKALPPGDHQRFVTVLGLVMERMGRGESGGAGAQGRVAEGGAEGGGMGAEEEEVGGEVPEMIAEEGWMRQAGEVEQGQEEGEEEREQQRAADQIQTNEEREKVGREGE
ncbi:unnamed protein product [Closterium sp. NIES-53]